MRFTRVLAVAIACAASGCGSAKHASSPTSGQTTVSRTVTVAPEPLQTEPAAPGETQRVDVYFLRNGKLAAAARLIPRAAALPSAALKSLFKGPTPTERAEGFTTAFAPDEHVTRLDVRNGVAIVDFSPLLSPITPEFAQAVWTLTQFPSIKRLSIILETQDAAEFGRAAVEQFAAPIILDEPTPGDTVKTPLALRGTAKTPGGTISYEIRDSSGALVKSGSFQTAGSGRRADFSTTIPFSGRSGARVELDVFETTNRHGTDVRVPLRIR